MQRQKATQSERLCQRAMLQWQGKDMVKVQQRQVSRNSDNWSKKREGNRGAKKAEITLTSQSKRWGGDYSEG